MVLEMKRLNRRDHRYKHHEQKFYESWQHPNKTAEVKSIFYADKDHIRRSWRGRNFSRYKNRGNWRSTRVYHGTQRACRIGDRGDYLTPCRKAECYLCCILWESFKVERAAQGGMFGKGIYSSPTSSKADIYAKNHHVASNLHAIFICRVVYGNTETKYSADNTMTGPSLGFDSVKGATQQNGGALLYPEVVVYRDDAIIPVGLILYTRQGWEP